MEVKFVFPLPPRQIHRNARVHWRVKAKYTALARDTAKKLANSELNKRYMRGERIPRGIDYATMLIVLYTKTWRIIDPGNAIDWMKAYLDGIVDTGFLSDDKYVQFDPVQQNKDQHEPRVEIYLKF